MIVATLLPAQITIYISHAFVCPTQPGNRTVNGSAEAEARAAKGTGKTSATMIFCRHCELLQEGCICKILFESRRNHAVKEAWQQLTRHLFQLCP